MSNLALTKEKNPISSWFYFGLADLKSLLNHMHHADQAILDVSYLLECRGMERDN